MNIAILVHSRTGNTLQVANRLLQRFQDAGHTGAVIEVKASGGSGQDPSTLAFEGVPELDGYQGLVFAAPVHGFSPAPDMAEFMRRLPSLKGKSAACLVTQAFPFAWMGGTRSTRLMGSLCESRGASVLGYGVVNWGRSCREALIERAVERLTGLF